MLVDWFVSMPINRLSSADRYEIDVANSVILAKAILEIGDVQVRSHFTSIADTIHQLNLFKLIVMYPIIEWSNGEIRTWFKEGQSTSLNLLKGCSSTIAREVSIQVTWPLWHAEHQRNSWRRGCFSSITGRQPHGAPLCHVHSDHRRTGNFSGLLSIFHVWIKNYW